MCDVTPPVHLSLPMDTAAPARARAFVAQARCPVHSARVLDHARLLISELVTNAVRHGAPPVTTEIECRGNAGMHVRVSDAAPGAPVVRDVDLHAESGRGMALVDLLSAQWGVEPGQAGKAVWFQLRGDAITGGAQSDIHRGSDGAVEGATGQRNASRTSQTTTASPQPFGCTTD